MFHDIYDCLYCVKDIEELIYETRFQIEKVLFQNKTLICLDKVNSNYQENQVKLIQITNEYFGKRGLEFLISRYLH